MEVLIISDTHAMNREDLLAVLHRHPVDYYIHCGDIFSPYRKLPLSNLYLVRGNNDFNKAKEKLTPFIDNHRFFITHGHLYNVYYNMHSLLQAAKEEKANIVCFGHTHVPFLQTIDNILVINPGSAYYPRGDYFEPTYCILDTSTLLVTYYHVADGRACGLRPVEQ